MGRLYNLEHDLALMEKDVEALIRKVDRQERELEELRRYITTKPEQPVKPTPEQVAIDALVKIIESETVTPDQRMDAIKHLLEYQERQQARHHQSLESEWSRVLNMYSRV